MRILCVDDDLISLKVLGAILSRWGHEGVYVQSGSEALKFLETETAEMLITDWVMPGMNGLELCKAVRQMSFEYYLPIILLTTKSTKGDLADGLMAGADVFCSKPLNPKELAAQMLVIERFRQLQKTLTKQVAELREANRIIQGMALTDDLTLLPNRRACYDRLTTEVSRTARHGDGLSVFLLDLDRFKMVNDTYGHAAGDRVLTEASSRIEAALRNEDFLGRYGGEEFIGILSQTTLSGAEMVCTRVLKNLAATPIDLGGPHVRMTASIGLVEFNGSEEVDRIVARADAALYKAKENGRNCVMIG